MRLQYRTRGESSPQGKPRVYYTGHPADAERYLEEIAEDILRRQNCAIYYDAEPEAAWDTEELRHEINEMQLMVIPVTSQFLYQSNRAREVELPLALELHVPVLPILQEPGIGMDFNERCGDLQFMDRHGEDPTAMPYEERLEQFLQNILVGDARMEKVRAAFYAYAFLSYRKKDRRYAQEIMRLIHKNDFCRDLAIWYDEFLTPGENYNNAIEAALLKCCVFMMVITPNILEPDNYVMLTEYPSAQGHDKPILPLAATQTSQEALADRYKGLPPCTDAYDETALAASLRECLQETLQGAHAHTPEQDYYIGLAYLNGIDVEIDRERGLALIQSAAERRVPEAVRQLANMYCHGNGVIRDYEEAIRWQQRLVDICGETYERTGIEDDGLQLCCELVNLAEVLDYLDLDMETLQVYGALDQIATQMLANQENRETRRMYLDAHYRLGRQYMAIDNLARAEEILMELVPLCKELRDPSLLNTVSDLYDSLGSLTWLDGRFEEAGQWFDRGLHVDEILCEYHPTFDTRDRISTSYEHMGHLYMSRHQLEQAREWYSKALTVRLHIMEEDPSSQHEARVASIYRDLADCYMDARVDRAVRGALHYARKEFEIRIRQAVEENTVSARRNLADVCCRIANVLKRMYKGEQAEEWYCQATDIGEQLYALTERSAERRMLEGIYNDHGCNLCICGYIEEALDVFERARALRRAAPKECMNVEDHRNYVTLMTNMAMAYVKAGQPDAAEKCHLEARLAARMIQE